MQPHELTITKPETRGHTAGRILAPILLSLAVAALTLYAYRELLARPFAADDYEWLLNVRDLSFGALVRRAFDFGAQSHFYRPLVWLLLWAEQRAFGVDPRGYHVVSLALHLLNAVLSGLLAWRLTKDQGRRIKDQTPRGRDQTVAPLSMVCGLSSILVVAIVALHPAPFEAVVWISAQSELLAAALLLIALHLWLPRGRTQADVPEAVDRQGTSFWSLVFRPRSILAILALGLALLAKESAAIGLPLLILAGCSATRPAGRTTVQRFAPYLLPTFVTLAYVAVQLAVERRNYVLQEGIYGFGPQLIQNPLRALALLVAPLPGTEHADKAWLVPVGAAVALLLLGFASFDLRHWMRPRRHASAVQHRTRSVKYVVALALTLLPTAPFVAPPNSRYLYLPVIAGALLLACLLDHRPTPKDQQEESPLVIGRWSLVLRRTVLLFIFGLASALAWWSAGELHIREWSFGAGAAGPGGSLWRLTTSICAEGRPDRVLVVEPPLAPQHARAIVALSCGPEVETRVVARNQIDAAIGGHTLVVEFPGGSAQVARRT
jgi:hypothetical protein